MIKPFNPLELLPYIRDEEYASPLIERYVWATPLERNRILEQARELGRAPIVGAFHFPDFKTRETEALLLFEGYSTAEKTTLSRRGNFKTQNIKIPQLLAVDKNKRFEFTIEYKDGEKAAFITVCQIYKKHRRKGYFPTMVGAIQDYCFNELRVNTILGNARVPRTDAEKNWRTDLVTHNNIKISALQSLWLKQPYAVLGQ